MSKSDRQVLREFMSAPSVEDWVRSEAWDYLVGDLDDSTAAQERFSEAIRNLAPLREEFFACQADTDEILGVLIGIHGRNHPDQVGLFRQLPSPLVLLEMCAAMCEVGDEVVVAHRYGSGHDHWATAIWPFGVDKAADLTAPHGAETPAELVALERSARGAPADTTKAGRFRARPLIVAAAVVAAAVAFRSSR